MCFLESMIYVKMLWTVMNGNVIQKYVGSHPGKLRGSGSFRKGLIQNFNIVIKHPLSYHRIHSISPRLVPLVGKTQMPVATELQNSLFTLSQRQRTPWAVWSGMVMTHCYGHLQRQENRHSKSGLDIETDNAMHALGR